LRANGNAAWFGWPDSPQLEAEIASWFVAKSLAEEQAAMRRINKAALDFVVYAPTGFFLLYQAWRKNVSGIVKGPLPFFWGVAKSAGTAILSDRPWPTPASWLGPARSAPPEGSDFDVRLRRTAYRGDHSGDGAGRLVRVQLTLHCAGRPRRGDRRRPGDAR